MDPSVNYHFNGKISGHHGSAHADPGRFPGGDAPVKIFSWSADNSGCGWYRMQMPSDELSRRGHETLVGMQMPDEWLDTADVLIGQRVCMYDPSIRWQRVAQHPKRPLMVFELDDDLWQVPPSSEESHAFFSQPGVGQNLRTNIRLADLVTVSTEPLADLVRKINPNVTVIPNFIPAGVLDLAGPERVDDRFVVGWAGSSTHAMDWDEAAPQLARWFKRNPAAVYHAIGGTFPSQRKFPRDRLRVTGWVDGIWDYYEALGAFDIALAPLHPHVFNQSKSWLKALEAAARGLPIVASDVGPYPQFVRHGETGLLVTRPHEWSRALTDLVLDASMRTEMSTAARHLAAQHTIEGNGHLWEDALLSNLTTAVTRKEAS